MACLRSSHLFSREEFQGNHPLAIRRLSSAQHEDKQFEKTCLIDSPVDNEVADKDPAYTGRVTLLSAPNNQTSSMLCHTLASANNAIKEIKRFGFAHLPLPTLEQLQKTKWPL